MKLSRRQLLSLAAARLLSGTETPALFEEIPPSASGITWVHDNAMSDERYLPETLGPGCAFLDYDNDGWPDIFVTSYGDCILYKNNHDGTFSDVTKKAGLATPGWTTSAVWFDYDNDGKLDLFLCSFVDYGKTEHLSCGDNKLGRHYYCIPRVFKGTASFLYHNNG